MAKKIGRKDASTLSKTNAGVKKSKRRGQKLKDSELRARLDKVVQERDEAKERGQDVDEAEKDSVHKALAGLVSQSRKPVSLKKREPEQLNDILSSLGSLKTDAGDGK